MKRQSIYLLLSAAILSGFVGAARAELNGFDVVICDLDPEAERKIGEVMQNASRAYGRMTKAPLPPTGAIKVVRSIEEAAAPADFIQESLPEQEELKIKLLAKADAAARPGGGARTGRPPWGPA